MHEIPKMHFWVHWKPFSTTNKKPKQNINPISLGILNAQGKGQLSKWML